MTVPQARRLRDIPDAAIALIEGGAIGLDNVLADLAADPGFPDAVVDEVPGELAEARWDEANCGDRFE